MSTSAKRLPLSHGVWAEGKRVRLDFDPANAPRDHNDNTQQRRTLAYVFLEDGTLINAGKLSSTALASLTPAFRLRGSRSFGNWAATGYLFVRGVYRKLTPMLEHRQAAISTAVSGPYTYILYVSDYSHGTTLILFGIKFDLALQAPNIERLTNTRR